MSKYLYIVQDDERTCDECAEFIDFIVDDPIAIPPFHPNCRCDIEEVDDDTEVSQSGMLLKALLKATLKNNASETGKIFNLFEGAE